MAIVDKNAKLKLLKKVNFLKPLPREILETLAMEFKDVFLKPHESLFEEGEPGDFMYIILSGQLVVSKDDMVIARRGPGEYLGEMALIESKPRSATVRSVIPSHLLEISREQFHSQFARVPEALFALLQTLSERTREDLKFLGRGLSQSYGRRKMVETDRLMDQAGLSRRQKEVALLVCTGISDKELAKRLLVSPHTVRDHLKKIFIKLDVHSRTQMIALLNK